MLLEWTHTVCNLWGLAFLTQHNFLAIHSSHCMLQQLVPFSLLSSTPRYGRSKVHVAICLLKDI